MDSASLLDTHAISKSEDPPRADPAAKNGPTVRL
jgi:hypothetical protein